MKAYYTAYIISHSQLILKILVQCTKLPVEAVAQLVYESFRNNGYACYAPDETNAGFIPFEAIGAVRVLEIKKSTMQGYTKEPDLVIAVKDENGNEIESDVEDNNRSSEEA